MKKLRRPTDHTIPVSPREQLYSGRNSSSLENFRAVGQTPGRLLRHPPQCIHNRGIRPASVRNATREFHEQNNDGAWACRGDRPAGRRAPPTRQPAAHHGDRRRRGDDRARYGAAVAQRHARGQDRARGARRQQRRHGRGDRRDEVRSASRIATCRPPASRSCPRYNYTNKPDGTQEAELVAYQVTNTLSVRVRDLVKTGEILDKSVSLGVNQGGGISFTNDDPSTVMTEARKKAVADADRQGQNADRGGRRQARHASWRFPTSPSAPPPMPIEAKAFDKAARRGPDPGRRKRLPGPGQRHLRAEIDRNQRPKKKPRRRDLRGFVRAGLSVDGGSCYR